MYSSAMNAQKLSMAKLAGGLLVQLESSAFAQAADIAYGGNDREWLLDICKKRSDLLPIIALNCLKDEKMKKARQFSLIEEYTRMSDAEFLALLEENARQVEYLKIVSRRIQAQLQELSMRDNAGVSSSAC